MIDSDRYDEDRRESITILIHMRESARKDIIENMQLFSY